MNTTRVVAVATLTLTGFAAAQAGEAAPAWRTDGFVVEEIVVIAMAPKSCYTEEFVMEEIVVTVEAPDPYFIREIVVTATSLQFEVAVAALEALKVEATLVPVTEEIGATARNEDKPLRLVTRFLTLRDTMHF